MKTLRTILLFFGAALAAAAIFVYAGFFSIAADEPHWAMTHALMEIIRERSIAVRTGNIEVPGLDDPALIATGAQHYNAMCRDCHLAPGASESELRRGLYPQPPSLIEPVHLSPAQTFWVIKHGIKMSGMPAWGKTHDDQSIWALVAFLRQLPTLTPAQYQAAAKVNDGSHHHARPHD